MATLGDLKTRIIAESTRDDLADDFAVNLTQAITEAIDHYAPQRFWFNEVRTTGTTVANNEYMAMSTLSPTIRWIDRLIINIGPGYDLVPDTLVNIELLALTSGAGQPTRFARYAPAGADQLRFFPKPTSAYGLTFLGTADQTPMVNTSDTNAWSLYAYDLIASRAKYLLCRDLFRDTNKMNTAQAAEQDALRRLRAETGMRTATGRMRAHFP